jgi:hypothetical protein
MAIDSSVSIPKRKEQASFHLFCWLSAYLENKFLSDLRQRHEERCRIEQRWVSNIEVHCFPEFAEIGIEFSLHV